MSVSFSSFPPAFGRQATLQEAQQLKPHVQRLFPGAEFENDMVAITPLW